MTSGFPASVTVLRSPEQVRPRGLPAVCRHSAYRSVPRASGAVGVLSEDVPSTRVSHCTLCAVTVSQLNGGSYFALPTAPHAA